jgi:hypothetical protein
MRVFRNESQPIDAKEIRPGHYGYNYPSKFLFEWSNLLQAVISQAATFMLTGKYHNSHCAIYKCEGGCVVQGVGELVLQDNYCYFDYRGSDKKTKAQEMKCAQLITKIILEWDPMDPIDSMLKSAAGFIEDTPDNLKAAVERSSVGGVFGGSYRVFLIGTPSVRRRSSETTRDFV